MRVIAGSFRSRQLIAPQGQSTRPTSDRLRETLFNILAPRLPGSRFVDLYAGSGAVGVEALSRGAAHVWFADKAPPALQAIRANLSLLGITSGFSIESHGTTALIKKLIEAGSPALDIVFLDPPWVSAAEYTSTLGLLGSKEGAGILANHGLVVAEHSSRVPLLERYGLLTQTRTLKQGDAALSFYALG